jgi:hypothetical protein
MKALNTLQTFSSGVWGGGEESGITRKANVSFFSSDDSKAGVRISNSFLKLFF